jgi:ATP-dependent Clp protease ATP-binding subunit ClpX
MGKQVLGFRAAEQDADSQAEIPASEAIRYTEPEDLLSFGMIPEFVGRLPVVTALDQLSEEELMMILTETKNAMVKQFTKLFAMENVGLTVTKDGLRALASLAATKGTGARALRSMLERIMLDLMYEIPSRDDVSEVIINRAVVEGKKQPTIRRKQDKDAA